ncbi:hypothetical protein HNP63_000627 [Borreliella afzelii]|uniref:Lipoprotein n=1 Tax=Borreliella afzelii TaxID=29518 RepID=A0AB34Z2A2_BORAF|nr:hypothetical protein [Borreliella afzelii]
MFVRKGLFFLLLFLALLIIISCRVKNVSAKNSNYIVVKGISKKNPLNIFELEFTI